ncbi:MAG: class I SAM-dependent methyltransferase [Pseudanabaena sp. ELA607]
MNLSAINSELERIKEHFDEVPYPIIPLEFNPRNNANHSFSHSMVEAFYRRDQKIIDLHGKSILDVGCGTGITTQCLAVANPHTEIVGIDISPKSIEIARQRLEFHDFKNVEFHAIGVEELTTLGQKFDYINCDETLYLLPDPLLGLQMMRDVLAPTGIIRTNLHDAFQRAHYLRAQELSKFLGILDDCPREIAAESLCLLMNSLRDTVNLKSITWWDPDKISDNLLFANHLLRGDKGFTIPETFELLEAANLQWLGMRAPKFWNINLLFKEGQNIPDELELLLHTASEAELLYFHDLLHPVNRLIDFYCCHPDVPVRYEAPVNWDDQTWQQSQVSLSPVIRDPDLEQAINHCLRYHQPLALQPHFKENTPEEINLLFPSVFCLKLLWRGPKSFRDLVRQYQQALPMDLLDFHLKTTAEVADIVKTCLIDLEELHLVLLGT